MLTMAKTIRHFWSDLRKLMEAGMPIVESLKLIYKGLNPDNPFAQDLVVIMSEIAHGSSFYEALSKHNKFFGPLEINLIKASEISGMLDLALIHLTNDSIPTKADEYDNFYAALGVSEVTGVPALTSLKSAQVYCSGALGAAVKKFYDEVRDGNTLAAPMDESRLFCEGEIDLIDFGYEVGGLGDIFQILAN